MPHFADGMDCLRKWRRLVSWATAGVGAPRWICPWSRTRRLRNPPRALFPNEAQVLGSDGEPVGGVLIFVKDGYLASLEVYAYEDRISPFPPVDRLDLTVVQRTAP